MAKRRFWPACR